MHRRWAHAFEPILTTAETPSTAGKALARNPTENSRASGAPRNMAHSLLSKLAVAMVALPGASLQELAAAAGISKTTLHRSCRTRDELMERLTRHAVTLLEKGIENAGLKEAAVPDALWNLTRAFLNNHEFSQFLTYYWRPDMIPIGEDGESGLWEKHLGDIDAFFLRGQLEGHFRADIGAAVLSELFTSILGGLVEAERRGRIARAGMAKMAYEIFMNGARPANGPAGTP